VQVESIVFAGFGEPTLHPGFPEMLLEADQREIETSFSTNGASFPDTIRNLLPSMRFFRHINFSIDSPIEAEYGDIRGGKLSKALQSAKDVAKALEKTTVTVSMSAVAMASNFPNFKFFPKILRMLGINVLVVQSLLESPNPFGVDHLASLPESTKYCRELQEAAAVERIAVNFEMPERLELELSAPKLFEERYTQAAEISGRTRLCILPWESAHVDARGRVFPCCRAAALSKAEMGDLTHERFQDIWSGPSYQQFRRGLLDPDAQPEVCQNCLAAPLSHMSLFGHSAEVSWDDCFIGENRVSIVATNIGKEPWTSTAPIRVGTIRARDRISPAATSDWLSPNRPAGALEECVSPGDRAHLNFSLGTWANGEAFQLVVDGHHWLPGTAFKITHNAEGSPVILPI